MNLHSIQRRYFDLLNITIYTEKSNDINFYECPVCLDGKSRGHKHRCHWVFEANESYVHCFNCGFALSFPQFIKYINEDLYSEYLNEIRHLKNDTVKQSFQLKIENNLLTEPISIATPYIKENSKKKVEIYLKKRKLEEFKDYFFEDAYGNIVTKMLFKLPNNDVYCYGYQTKNTETKDFYIIIDRENRKFKLWNYNNIDFNKEIYIFEGVEDALASGFPIDQICAGYTKSIPDYIIEKMKYPIICFDNDVDGKKGTARIISKHSHAKALIYPKKFQFKDTNEMLMNIKDIQRNHIKDFIIKNIKSNVELKIIINMYKEYKIEKL